MSWARRSSIPPASGEGGQPRTKNPGAQRRQGRNVLEQTDSPLALFCVVAISQARRALNQSTVIPDYHYGGGEATDLMIGSNTSGGDHEAVHSVGGRTAACRCFSPGAASPAHQP